MMLAEKLAAFSLADLTMSDRLCLSNGKKLHETVCQESSTRS